MPMSPLLNQKKYTAARKVFYQITFVGISFLLPVLAVAQSISALETTDTGWVGCDGTECNWVTFINLVTRVMRNIYVLAFFVLVIMFAYAGYLVLTSGSDAGKRTKARSVITGVVIGMIVMFFSYAIVIYVLNTLGVERGFFDLLVF